ncbi:Zinc knuckle [Popillia japonica]|uniref:Zinc knuckle n=1 Tax=Popillia japonica TaxID=7064 RepID=A0AAW1HFM8_POPJA
MEFVKSRLLDEELKTEKPNKTSKNHDGEVTFNATQVICFKCNQNGHKSYECQNKKNFRRGAFNNRGTRARRTGNFGAIRAMNVKIRRSLEEVHLITEGQEQEELEILEIEEICNKRMKVRIKQKQISHLWR